MDQYERQPRSSSRSSSASTSQHAIREWVPQFVLWVALAVTIGAAIYVHATSVEQDHARFKHDAERNRAAIAYRIETYTAALRNVAALFEAGGIPNREQFHSYLSYVDLRNRYPGMQGIGFSSRIAAADLPKAQHDLREKHDAAFRVWPKDPARSEYHAILFLEPGEDARNVRAYGYDMHSEAVRAAAMDAACVSGLPAASGKVQLLQDTNLPN